MAAPTDAAQATNTEAVSIDSTQGINPSAAKPAERFLIGVLIALFIILGLCAVFLLRRVIISTIQRLRDQRSAVGVIIQQKRRRKKPRLFDVWIEGALERRDNSLILHETWESMQPLAMSVEYPDTSSTTENGYREGSINAQHALVVDSSLCRPAQTHCHAGSDATRMDEPPTSSEESGGLRRISGIVDATAQIHVLISLPNQSRSIHYPLPTPSPNRISESWTDQPYLIATCSCEVEVAPVPSDPPSLALGVVPSPLIMYQ